MRWTSSLFHIVFCVTEPNIYIEFARNANPLSIGAPASKTTWRLEFGDNVGVSWMIIYSILSCFSNFGAGVLQYWQNNEYREIITPYRDMTFRQFNVESITQATNTGAKSFLPYIYCLCNLSVCRCLKSGILEQQCGYTYYRQLLHRHITINVLHKMDAVAKIWLQICCVKVCFTIEYLEIRCLVIWYWHAIFLYTKITTVPTWSNKTHNGILSNHAAVSKKIMLNENSRE